MTATQANPHPSTVPVRSPGIFSWAIFVAVSWTWCIGMFLPVLLLRDIGMWGFVAFAIPNMVGAAAMGWFPRGAARSREFVARHESACAWFSIITIIYQVFFAGWMIQQIAGPATGIMLIAAVGFFWVLFRWGVNGKSYTALFAFLLSVALVSWACYAGYLPDIARPLPGSRISPLAPLWITPAFIFSFALCPQLDLTFHAARQSMSPRQSRIAFPLAFLLLFPVMLLCSVFYSGTLARGFDPIFHPQLSLILAAHFIVHCAFVITAHARQLAGRFPAPPGRKVFLFAVALAAIVWLGLLGENWHYRGLSVGEVAYRCFLGFYSLIFPTYVWLFAIRPIRSPVRLAVAIALALPMYWLAFVELRMIWFLPGVMVLLATKVGEKTTHDEG